MANSRIEASPRQDAAEPAELASLPADTRTGAVTLRLRNGVQLGRFLSRDPDETRAYLRGGYGEHSRVIHGTGRFLYAMNVVATEGVQIGHAQRWLPQTLRAEVQHPTLFFTPQPGESVRHGRQSWDLDGSCGFLAAPGLEYVRRGVVRRAFALRVDRDLLARAVDERLRGRLRCWAPRSVGVSMTPVRGGEFRHFFTRIRMAATPGGSWGEYGDARGFDGAVAGWMADLLIAERGIMPTTELGLQRVERLGQWIDEHAAEELSLDRLCAVAGVSRRSLQKGLLALRGQTPIEFVTARRLTAARRRLEDRTSPTQVATVAFDCGFRHLGRFAAQYRAAFGESPSETARVARARSSPAGR